MKKENVIRVPYTYEGETFWINYEPKIMSVKNIEKYNKEETNKNDIQLEKGDKVTYRYNGKIIEKEIVNENIFRTISKLKDYGIEILKVERPIDYKTIYEKKEEPILDDVEKRYLENFLRPFKYRVTNIRKVKYAFIQDKEMLAITICLPCTGNTYINLPPFESNKMYKGMQLNKKYTLEELGLFKNNSFSHK